MLLEGGLGGLYPSWNVGFPLTLLQPETTDFAHLITACPPDLET